MTDRGLDAIFWDLGGVFTRSPFAAVGAAAAGYGLGRDALLELVFGPYHDDTDHPWHRLERGEVSLSHALEEIAAGFAAEGHDFEPTTFFGWMSGTTDEARRDRVIRAVERFSARGVRHALVTNNIAEARGRWSREWGLEACIEVIVDSSEVGLRKPDPAIYELALERMAVTDPSRTVFVDDFEPNVAAAVAVGMRGVIVRDDDVDAAIAELTAMV